MSKTLYVTLVALCNHKMSLLIDLTESKSHYTYSLIRMAASVSSLVFLVVVPGPLLSPMIC